MVRCHRFGHGHAYYRRFAGNYGWDVTRWDGHPVLRDPRELRLITTNARKATYTPETLPEVLRRIKVLRRSDVDRGGASRRAFRPCPLGPCPTSHSSVCSGS